MHVASPYTTLQSPAIHHFYGKETTELVLPCPPSSEVMICSYRCPGKQRPNEDGALVFCDGAQALLAVADGLGGQPDAHLAAASALESLGEALMQAEANDVSMREAILSGFDRANEAVLELGGAASTLVLAELIGDKLRSYHVGDSGIMAFSSRGTLRFQSIAHSPVGYAMEAGLLDEEGAMEHEDRHIVSNVIGDPTMHVGMSAEIPLRLQDTVVLASDGLFDNLYTDEIVNLLSRGSLRSSVRRTVAECRRRMNSPADGQPSKADDLTLLVYRSRQRHARR